MTNGYAMPETRSDDDLILQAYLDGELDASAVLAFERRIDAEARLKEKLDRLQALRTALSAHVVRATASQEFRDRIQSLAAPASRSVAHSLSVRRMDWRAMAAAASIAGCLASGATYFAVTRQPVVTSVAAIVAGHQRALLAGQSVDVASSDRHTVKPWFNSKLAISPTVIDLAAEGFPLVGGRVDIVGGQPVPTLVYTHREHLVSVVSMPKAAARDNDVRPRRDVRDGYTVLTWDGAGFEFSAVSDLALEDLESFIARWRAVAKSSDGQLRE